jgi:uncharacterized protein with PIN domain
MVEKIFHTNNQCENCNGSLIFEVRDAKQNKKSKKILRGNWICTTCKEITPGLWVGIARRQFQHTKENETYRLWQTLRRLWN